MAVLTFREEAFKKRLNLAKERGKTTIGKTKYANSMKLNSHTAASFVIARRGLGFKDVA